MSDYKVLAEKEYYKLSADKPTIGLLMMVKNESLRLKVSLESVKKTVQALIIYDTGSTDDTVKIIQDFSQKYKINLYLIQGEFVNFSTSRNVVLEYAEKVNVHYLLLLDCNDELQGGDKLLLYAKFMLDQPYNGFLTCQRWWSGQHDKYFNQRFIKNRCGWRYFGAVHEWMKDTTVEGPIPAHPVIRMPDDIVLFQDRTLDGGKTTQRFGRDKILLLEDYKNDPKDTRTLFYLAQTCECMGDYQDSLYYSKLRLELTGFDEEIFHSYMRCGTSSFALNHDWEDVMKWYIKAYEFSNRAEPLIKISDYYKMKQKWHLAYMFAHQACDLVYPDHLILFVDSGVYDYYRWHVMGIIGFYVGKYEEGKSASLKALERGINKEMNLEILQFYLDRENKSVANETHQQFMTRTIYELKLKYPKLPIKIVSKRANTLWKNRNKK